MADPVVKGVARMMLESAARHVLSGAALWLIGHQILAPSGQANFVNVGVGLVLGAAAAVLKWYDASGRKAMQDAWTIASARLAQRAAAAAPKPPMQGSSGA